MTGPPTAAKALWTAGPGLVLVGYRGTGKSTVGRILGTRTGRTFLDADVELETHAGASIASIFASEGEHAFRDREERILRELTSSHPGAILATGGGAVLRPSNRSLLGAFGFVVWLRADPGELARRLAADPGELAARPSLTGAGTIEEIGRVLEHRIPLYREVADAELDTRGSDPNQIAALILALWKR